MPSLAVMKRTLIYLDYFEKIIFPRLKLRNNSLDQLYIISLPEKTENIYDMMKILI